MEKNCLVTKLKSKTGNTNLPVMGFIKIKVSYISELNDDDWNQFVLYLISGKTVTVKILGEGYIYNSKADRESNTNGEKSVLLTSNKQLYFSNGDYEILIEKYTIEKIDSVPLRSDNIQFDYKTFENSYCTKLSIRFIQTNGVYKYPLNISGSVKNLPNTITDLLVNADAEHPVQLENFAGFAENLQKITILAKECSSGSFDSVKFPAVMDEFYISLCSFSGDLKNIPVMKNSSQNYGFNIVYGDAQEAIERLAKNSDQAKNVIFYIQTNIEKVNWRDITFNNLPKPGYLYLTLNGTGGVTVYSDEARTNLLGSFNGTIWSYPS